jgi:hypothetical protein
LPGQPGEPGPDIMPPIGPSPEMPQPVAFGEGEGRSRGRRGRRGGRGRAGRGTEGDLPPPPPVAPAYRGPTPADPYFGQIDALFAVLDPDAEIDTTAEPARAVSGASFGEPLPEVAAVDAAVLHEPVMEVAAPTPEALPEALTEAQPGAVVAEVTPGAPSKPARASRARKPKVTAVAPEALAEGAEAAMPERMTEVAAKPARRRSPARAKAAAVETTLAEPVMAWILTHAARLLSSIDLPGSGPGHDVMEVRSASPRIHQPELIALSGTHKKKSRNLAVSCSFFVHRHLVAF